MNFSKLLHHFCVMHHFGISLFLNIFLKTKNRPAKNHHRHGQWSCRNCPSGYHLHGSRFEGCCWFGIHGHGAPGTDDCHLNSIDGTLAKLFEMRARKMVAAKRETWYLLFIVYRQHACTASKHTLTTLTYWLHVYICSSSLRNCTSMLRTHGIDYHICIYQDDVVFTGFLHSFWCSVHRCIVVLVVRCTWFMFFVLFCFHSPCICWRVLETVNSWP